MHPAKTPESQEMRNGLFSNWDVATLQQLWKVSQQVLLLKKKNSPPALFSNTRFPSSCMKWKVWFMAPSPWQEFRLSSKRYKAPLFSRIRAIGGRAGCTWKGLIVVVREACCTKHGAIVVYVYSLPLPGLNHIVGRWRKVTSRSKSLSQAKESCALFLLLFSSWTATGKKHVCASSTCRSVDWLRERLK
jgi:hypothetical protein